MKEIGDLQYGTVYFWAAGMFFPLFVSFFLASLAEFLLSLFSSISTTFVTGKGGL